MLHAYKEDFYGKTVAVVALGYIRPEMKFTSVGESLETRTFASFHCCISLLLLWRSWLVQMSW